MVSPKSLKCVHYECRFHLVPRALLHVTPGLRAVKHRPDCYTSCVTEQEIVDLFAKVAKPRLIDLLKLKVRHVYETIPGNAE
jgi:hypothetical protein